MTVLLFLSMIVLSLAADFFIQRRRRTAAVQQPQRLSSPFRTPGGIFFAPSHTWMSLFPSGNVRIGADDFVLRMMENPSVVFLKHAGARTKKGDALFVLQEGSHRLTVRSPLDGEIVDVNEDVQKHPEMLKEMLFSNGWAYTVKPERTNELTNMLLGEKSRTWIQHELRQLRDFIAQGNHNGVLSPVLLQDGGIPVEGMMKDFTSEQCERFEQQFLQSH